MCDYSIDAKHQREAVQDDQLVTCRFPGGSIGFRSPSDDMPSWEERQVVCLRPGTEIAFATIPYQVGGGSAMLPAKTAIFRHRDTEGAAFKHRDYLEFPDGLMVPLASLAEFQYARVLQVPAKEALPLPNLQWTEEEIAALKDARPGAYVITRGKIETISG